MISNGVRSSTATENAPARFDVFDLARGLAILGMLGSHLVGTEGGSNAIERGVTGLLAAIEPTVGALFCVLAGMAWSIQAERVGVTAPFRRYVLGRALALGAFGVVFHILFWKTEILVPFALMMALSLIVLGSRPRVSAIGLVLLIAAAPLVGRLVAPWAATDWVENGLHAADFTVGWVTLRYLLVDGNYPLISWMAFPLMGILFWQSARSRRQVLGWCVGSLGVAAVTYAIAAYAAPVHGWEPVRQWIASGWTPTSAVFVVTAGAGAVAVVSALRWLWGTGPMPGAIQPLVLFGRASLSHYVAHIAMAYSLLRLWYPDEDWAPGTGLWALMAYLVIAIPLTMLWFRHNTHGPLEALLARSSRRPAPRRAADGAGQSLAVEVKRDGGAASLRALRSFAPDEIVFPLEGRPVTQPTRFTIQVGAGAHLDPLSELTSPWAYLNHGCDPNVVIDVTRRAVLARRPISAGDELRFDYNTTEWGLAEPFSCNCGTPGCVGVVLGFSHLSPTQQQLLLGDVAPHIRVLYETRRRSTEERSSREVMSPGAYKSSKLNVKTI